MVAVAAAHVKMAEAARLDQEAEAPAGELEMDRLARQIPGVAEEAEAST